MRQPEFNVRSALTSCGALGDLVVGPWVTYSTFLRLSFPVSKTGLTFLWGHRYEMLLVFGLRLCLLGSRNGILSQHQHNELENGHMALGFVCSFVCLGDTCAEWMDLNKLYVTWEQDNHIVLTS